MKLKGYKEVTREWSEIRKAPLPVIQQGDDNKVNTTLRTQKKR